MFLIDVRDENLYNDSVTNIRLMNLYVVRQIIYTYSSCRLSEIDYMYVLVQTKFMVDCILDGAH